MIITADVNLFQLVQPHWSMGCDFQLIKLSPSVIRNKKHVVVMQGKAVCNHSYFIR